MSIYLQVESERVTQANRLLNSPQTPAVAQAVVINTCYMAHKSLNMAAHTQYEDSELHLHQ